MSGTTPETDTPLDLPLLPLRDVVVFPHMVIPLFVGRAKSIKALELAMEGDRRIMLVAQKAASKDEPSVDDMFEVGCVSTILQMLKLPDGTVKVLVEGQQRALVVEVTDHETHFTSKPRLLDVQDDAVQSSEVEALRRAVTQQFDQYVKLNKKIPSEILSSISGIDSPGRLADTIAAHLPLKLENKQQVLNLSDVKERLENLFEQLEREVDILNVDKRIRGRVKRQMEKNQRDFYLNDQVKAIQKELGEGEDGADLEEVEKKIKLAKMPVAARKKAEAELKKLKLMSPMSAEATVVRNYIDVLTGLPWSKKTKIKHDLANAEEVLNADHFGLEKVKDRIVEYLAVQQRVDKVKAPILCLVGPLAWARPRWASRSPRPRAASTCAWPWAACGMKPRSAATAAPTSAPCRARCCRAWRRWARAIRCSCWTRSTSWAWTSAVTLPARCWKCWTPSRTTPSATTTSRSTSTCRT